MGVNFLASHPLIRIFTLWVSYAAGLRKFFIERNFEIITMPVVSSLFGNASSRAQSKNLVECKAGKMSLKGKMVHPDKRKGLLYVYQSDDSLMHFCWKDRQTGTVEDVSRTYWYTGTLDQLHAQMLACFCADS